VRRRARLAAPTLPHCRRTDGLRELACTTRWYGQAHCRRRRFIVPRARIVVKIDHEMNSKTKDFAEDADRIKDLIENADLRGTPKVVSIEIKQEFDSEE
jgi:hypothetical protein